jgi:hypothetical protein
MITDDLDPRLAAMEARVPVDAALPDVTHSRRPRSPMTALIVAPALVLVVGATALAGAAATGLIAFGAPGVENPGQPLAGANLECMTPPQAAAYLSAHGFANVDWQIETTAKDPNGSTTPQPPVIAATPPEHGYVVPGSIVDGQLLMIVDQRPGATGTGACSAMPMP